MILINSDNNPPYPPHIEGPTNCYTRETYYYNITIIDPDNDRLIALNVLFGDGTNLTLYPTRSSCCKGWRSNMTLTVGHKWKESGDYSIKAKVKDTKWTWSDWGTLDVHVQKSKLEVITPIRLDFNMLKLLNMLVKHFLAGQFGFFINNN